ncbi:MAG: HAD family hydrolase [Steroidobacteraceae bacterium]
MVAVFDLDGTITRRDTLFPYVVACLARRPWRLAKLLLVLPALLVYALGGRDRGRLKAKLIGRTLGGATRADIAAWNDRYLPRVMAHGLLRDAVAAIARHRSRGDALVLMSASVDLYVPSLGERLGFDRTICTGVAWHGGRLTGALTTPNRRGAEKARCLAALRAEFGDALVTAYGNSASDLPHLRLADRGVLVNASRATLPRAKRDGIECVQWRGTWRPEDRSNVDRPG